MARFRATIHGQRTEALARLHEWIKPGDTLHTILRSRSRSGMSRRISVVAVDRTDGSLLYLDGNVAHALGRSLSPKREGIRMDGCGMDMGFALVYELSRAMFPTGHPCVGDRCPSNDHSNGDRDYTPHPHRDGGYALRQRWL